MILLINKENFLEKLTPLMNLNILLGKHSDIPFNPIGMTKAKINIIKARIETDMDFRHAWTNNYSSVFYSDLYDRLYNQSNIMLRTYGEPNSGKSYMTLFLTQIMKEYLDFDYQVCWSKTEAGLILALKQYEANKQNTYVGKFTLLVDEDTKRFGKGAGQEEAYFNSMREFLRKAQINIIINNPNDTTDTDIQLETINYTLKGKKGISYTKSIIYYLINKRTSTYKPMGYILTEIPSMIYVNPYNKAKDRFLKDFTRNRNPAKLKNNKIIEIVFKNMDNKTKQLIKMGILLNKEYGVNMLINNEISNFNLPTAYTKQLLEQFKWRYYKKEIEENWNRQKDKMQTIVTKDLNSINSKIKSTKPALKEIQSPMFNIFKG